MLARRLTVAVCLLVLLVGCKKLVPVPPSQIGSLKDRGKAVIYTKDDRVYEYDSFQIIDDVFIGRTGKVIGLQPGRAPAPGRVPLAEIQVLKDRGVTR